MPSSASLSFTEPHEYQSRIRPAEVQVTPVERGDFRATLAQTNLHRLTLQHGWQSLSTVARGALNKSRISIMFRTGTAHGIIKVDGIELSTDVITQGAPGEEHFFQLPSDCSWATLTLTPETYGAARAALVGDDFNPAVQTSLIRPARAATARLRTLHHSVMNLVPTVPARGMHPEVARAAEQTVLAAVMDCVAGDSDEDTQPLGGRNSIVVMRKLYELLDASDGLPLYLVDVCAQLSVSARTLHGACAEHVGLSPRRFLWLRRMQLARQALIAADPGTATVTRIATDFGFWELGRFAGRYKWLFGESPSATLGRRRSAFEHAARLHTGEHALHV